MAADNTSAERRTLVSVSASGSSHSMLTVPSKPCSARVNRKVSGFESLSQSQHYHASVTVDGQKIFERDWSSGLSDAVAGIGPDVVAAQVGEPVHDGGGGRVEINER